MSKGPLISVVTPVYGCRTCLPQLYARLSKTLGQISQDFEIIMVNDASPDGAWEAIEKLAAEDPRVKGVNLSRNFGQHRAITAGLDYVSGEWVVVMDCDLQDQPEQILKLFEPTKAGYDVVLGRRFKRQTSRVFNAILSALTGEKLDPAVANFGVYRRSVIEGFRRIRDVDRSFP